MNTHAQLPPFNGRLSLFLFSLSWRPAGGSAAGRSGVDLECTKLVAEEGIGQGLDNGESAGRHADVGVLHKAVAVEGEGAALRLDGENNEVYVEVELGLRR